MKAYSTILFVLIAAFAMAQGSWTLKSSKFTVSGTSSLHDWTSDVTTVEGSGELTVEAGVLKSVSGVKVKIPVKGIKSPKGSIMDGKTYDALKHKTNPNITYQLTTVKGITKSGNGFALQTTGNLTIAGVTKPVDMTVNAKAAAGGAFEFSGEKQIKMTTYNMEPPTAMFGSIKTGDDVTIRFTVTLTPNATSSK